MRRSLRTHARTWSHVETTLSMRRPCRARTRGSCRGRRPLARSTRAARCNRRRRSTPGARSPPRCRTSAWSGGATARNELDRRVDKLHRLPRLCCQPSVLDSCLLPICRGRPSRCQGTRRAPHTAPDVRCGSAVGSAQSRAGGCSTHQRRAASTPRVPRFTASIGSTPARRVQWMNSSVPISLLDRAPGEVEASRRSSMARHRLQL